ncbi:hypothetical protein Tco_0238107 [Tanacetum coccineum]
MDEESIPWTAFLVPGGLYEWLVMPFGLKNTLAVFQRKMDKCFKGTESFIAGKFADAVTGIGVKINIEHIEGKHNTLTDSLSRLVNLCFAECTREMKELTTATLYSVEEVLQSPNAFQKNMKTTCEEVMKISNHFLESSQKLSSHLKNQEHYTNGTSSRLTKPQSEWINLMHGDQSLKTLNFQQQKKQLKPCETYKQSYNTKLKYALDSQPKITTGQIREKMFEFKIKKPEESSSNLKPWHKDWDAITSNHLK